jgi:hypothetical protein
LGLANRLGIADKDCIETQTQGNDKMTYAETNTLVKAIDEIETWAVAITREQEKESVDYDRVLRLQGFLQEAKEKVFDIANK